MSTLKTHSGLDLVFRKVFSRKCNHGTFGKKENENKTNEKLSILISVCCVLTDMEQINIHVILPYNYGTSRRLIITNKLYV